MEGRMASEFTREAEELARYYSELGRRLAQHGVRDVAELLALHDRLVRALDSLSRQEIGWAAEQTQRLLETLIRMDATVRALRTLKGVLAAQGDGGAGPTP
jgi:hypothetical protein